MAGTIKNPYSQYSLQLSNAATNRWLGNIQSTSSRRETACSRDGQKVSKVMKIQSFNNYILKN